MPLNFGSHIQIPVAERQDHAAGYDKEKKVIKMQKNDMTDFDLRMKSMLEDAREEVPAGVWDAVEARIAAPKRASF